MKANKFKMNKIIYFAFIFCALFSCTELEEEVFSQLSPDNFYNTPEDADTAIISIYNVLNRGLWESGMASLTFMPAPHTLARVPWRKYWATYQTSSADRQSLPRVWTKSYQAILRANVAISALEAKSFDDPINDAIRIELIGEAKWLRAFNFFNLVRLFGEVPMPTEATSTIEGANLPRTSIVKIYEQIIADLQYAETNLPDRKRNASKAGRPVVGTAKFLLGKVYLTMAGLPLNDASKMPMAHAKLKEVLDNRSQWGFELLPSYEDAIRIDNNAERIFATQQSREIENQGTSMAFVWGGRLWPYGRANSGGQFHGGYSKDFYDSYESTDVRRDVTMAFSYPNVRNGSILTYGTGQYNANFGIAPNKYHDPEQGCCDGSPDIVIYRFSDALLMYAEAENEINGPTTTAYQYLNEVRARGVASTYDPAGGLSQDEFRELIYKERFWELSFEFHEVYDLRRFGKVAEAIAANPEAQRAGTVYETKFELWPIPLAELQTNPELNFENNPGW